MVEACSFIRNTNVRARAVLIGMKLELNLIAYTVGGIDSVVVERV